MTDLVTAKEISDWIGVSDRTVSDLAIRGHAKKVGRGQYDLKETIRLYTAHLREVSAGRGDGQALDLVQERARLAKQQADGHELKNAVLRRELLARDQVEAEWTDILRKLRAGLLAIPSRVRQRIGLDANTTAEIDREIRDTLMVLGNDQEIETDGIAGTDPAASHKAL